MLSAQCSICNEDNNGMRMLAFKFARLVYLASVKKKFAAKCTKHAIFFNELIKQQTVLLA